MVLLIMLNIYISITKVAQCCNRRCPLVHFSKRHPDPEDTDELLFGHGASAKSVVRADEGREGVIGRVSL